MVMRNDEHYADPTPGQVIEAMEWIDGLPWTKCIVIFVEAPDELTRKGERKWEKNRD